jgi:outer membrane receptor protein involved in Fe transport
MNYNLGSVKLTSITGWRHSAERQTQDFDGSSTDLYYVDRIQNYTQWSQELRAAGNLFQGFDYVIGGFYFNSKYDFKQCSRVFGFSPNTPPCTFDAAPQIENAKSESYAAFADFNWAVVDKVRLSFGGRWSHDYKYLANGFLGRSRRVRPTSPSSRPRWGSTIAPAAMPWSMQAGRAAIVRAGSAHAPATPTMPPRRSSPKRSIPMKWAPSLICSTTA